MRVNVSRVVLFLIYFTSNFLMSSYLIGRKIENNTIDRMT